jgi:L-alanine-DL-glutamate epimerase-like enolase superfamily enzyme
MSVQSDTRLEELSSNTNTYSSPSALKITDLRIAVVARAPMTSAIIRIDTNQDIYGLGEIRDAGSPTYALMLKSRILGENPCNVDRLFRKIKQFGGPSRQAGGVCAIEMALWDLAGKAFSVPVYQLIGGKFRNLIRCYADTDESQDPEVCGRRLKARMEQGFTWLKMDLGLQLIQDQPGMVMRPTGIDPSRDTRYTEHPFTGVQITDKGIAALTEYMAAVREVVGMEIPLALDHFGHIDVNSCIRLGKSLEKYSPAWLEDMVPWYYTDFWKQITAAVDVPTMTGEDIYLKESFETLCRTHAVDMLHPDLATAGGILETKKIGDMAQTYGIPMVMHFAGTPVACMANVHCAAATENFLVLENHSFDVPWWDDLVEGVEKPIVNQGFIKVPDTPGLGVILNDEVVKDHLRCPGYFKPTPEWDGELSWDRLFS